MKMATGKIIRPHIDSEVSFERIRKVSKMLSHFGVEHTVVENDLEEPLGIYIEQVVSPDLMRSYVDTVLDMNINQSILYRRLLAKCIEPYSERIGVQYPIELERIINIAGLAVRESKDEYPVGMLAYESGEGDGHPHIDHPQLEDKGQAYAPNIHLTLHGKGVVRLGQMREFQHVELLRQGILDAYANGMRPREVDNNFTSALIEKNKDNRVPDTLKKGVALLEKVLEHPTDYIELNPGDVMIFDGAKLGQCLPVVHDFRTLKVGKSPEEWRRIFTVFKPKLMTLTAPAEDLEEKIKKSMTIQRTHVWRKATQHQ